MPGNDRRLTNREHPARRQVPGNLGVDPGEILESITDAFFALDEEWAFVYVNSQAERLLGRAREALLGRSIWEEFPEAVDSPFWNAYQQAARERTTVSFEAFYPPLRAWYSVRTYPRPNGLAVYFEDITERREIAQRVRELEERFRHVQEASPDGFVLFSVVRDDQGKVEDFTFLYVNPAGEHLLGRRDVDLRGHSLRDEMPGTVERGRFESYRQVAETGEAWRREFSYERKGREMVLRATAVKVGEGLAVSFTDVTDRVRAEQVLRASERRERFLAEVTRILASTLDYELTVQAAARLSVPDVADLCIVDVLDESGELRRAVVSHVDPELERTLVKSVGTPPAERTNANSALRQALDRRESVFLESLPPDVATQVAEPEIRELLEVIRPSALIAVPMLVHGEPLGVLQLVMGHASGRRFEHDDVTLVEEFARRAASAIDNARHYRIALAARRDAESANTAKSQFLATMSHELRTPLNAILGYAELLDIGVAGDISEAQREYLQRVRQSGRHLLALINDILDLSKVEAGQMSVRADAVPLLAALEPAMTFVRPQAEARGLELREQVECADETCALGDEARVRQIVTNLLANAVKFTEPGGRVEISCGRTASAPGTRAAPEAVGPEGWAFVRVTDSGIGIPRSMHERIFDPFVQVDSTHTRTQGGTGLGLAISRRLARLMHGDLTVDSEPGHGSVFTLWLPAGSASSQPSPQKGPAQRAPLPKVPVHELPPPASLEPLPHAEAVTPARAARVAAAEVIRGQLPQVLRGFAERLRLDPTVPRADMLSDADVEDHYAAFIADVAQQLAILEADDTARGPLIADGSAIQREISERHGAQRLRLGFSEANLHSEYKVLRDALEAALRETLGSLDGLEDAIGLLRTFLDEAEAISLRGYRDASYS